MRFLAMTAAAFAALTGVASAQTAADTSRVFTGYCEKYVRDAGGSPAAAAGACACGTGVVGGQLTPNEFVLLGILSPGLNDQAQLEAIITDLAAQGVPLEQVATIGLKLQEASPTVDRVCSYFENRTPGYAVAYESGAVPEKPFSISTPYGGALTYGALAIDAATLAAGRTQ